MGDQLKVSKTISNDVKPKTDDKKIDELVAQSVVLLGRQYLLIEHLIETGALAFQRFEAAIDVGKQNIQNVLEVYNHVLPLIDHMVRYQKIAHIIPRLNKKKMGYRALDDAMGNLKQDIRNTIQHIDKKIDNLFTGPLLGAICWVSGGRQFIASFHDIGRQRSSPGIIVDTKEGKFLHAFCYIYNEKYYDLDKAIEGIRTFNKIINSTVSIQIGGKAYDPSAHFVAGCFDFGQFIKDSKK